MNARKLVLAAALAAAIGVPTTRLIGDAKGQSMTSTGIRVPFLHGFGTGRTASQAELASLERASDG